MQPLGQHFLKNQDAITKIIGALDLRAGETIIEIGPGRGALTAPLAEACARIGCKLIAIEKDAALATTLTATLAKPLHLQSPPSDDRKIVEIVTGDALKELPSVIASTRSNPVEHEIAASSTPRNDEQLVYKIVGNIPYYITGQLLRVISELKVKPALTVLMVQKEVAERVAAQPPKMNLLSAATQIWADVNILFSLSSKDFDPPPKVQSAVITLGDRGHVREDRELKNYYHFIHVAFKQPRKTLLNNLAKDSRGWDLLQQLGYTEKTRAQTLTIAELLLLSQHFSSIS